ncbi:winged helix-turn-helix transcriptional regulator [Streptomyces sp. M19]
MKHSDDGGTTASAPTTRAGGRQGNVQRVLEALRLNGPSSQAALARRTRLSRATVNSIVKALREQGVAETRPVNGRESQVALVSRQGAVVSVQVNVASLRVALFDFGGHVRHDVAVPFEEGTGEEGGTPRLVVDTVGSLVSRAGLLPADLAGVAVGMQAPGAGHRSRHLLGALATARLAGCRGGQDPPGGARGGGVGRERRQPRRPGRVDLGRGPGAADFLYAMCSAGVGGGLVIDGRIYRGGDGLAGRSATWRWNLPVPSASAAAVAA